MSGKQLSSNVVSVDEQGFEQANERRTEESEFEVVDRPELRPTVQQETQAKVDANHPDTDGIARAGSERIHGVTLEQQERIQAREAELERISARADREGGTRVNRERRTRVVAAARSTERRDAFQKRAASVDPVADPELADPREALSQGQLAAVNRQAERVSERLDGWSTAAVSRRLAEAVVRGSDVDEAVLNVMEALKTAPGQVVPIGKLEDVDRQEVSIEGRVTDLWESDSAAIQQVGLIEDDSGRTKLTSWVASDQPVIEAGERVRIHGAAKNWYDGRVSVALTGWSIVHFPERERAWVGEA